MHDARARPAMMHARPRRGQGCKQRGCRPEMQTNVHLATTLPGPQPKFDAILTRIMPALVGLLVLPLRFAEYHGSPPLRLPMHLLGEP